MVLLAVASPVLPLHSQTSDAFDPGANGTVWVLVHQPDGKILVGGDFTSLGGPTRNRLGRLNPDGSLDAAFTGGTNYNNSSTWGANATVNCLAVQPDGKILLGGSFTTVGGQTRNRIARLNPDGSLDTNFVSTGASGVINALVVQTNGQIVVGGNFTLLGGQGHSSIGRLNADGSLDTNFNPVAVGTVNALTLQSDGAIVVGGNFSSLAGQGKPNLDRLNSDGTADTSFLATGANTAVYALAVQDDGRILAGGMFTTLNGTNSARLWAA
jgi:uncharacterized delta-60 repeat protein